MALLAGGKIATIDLGRFAYLLAAAYAMRRRPVFGCELRYGGTTEKVRLSQLSVINAPVFGGSLRHAAWPDAHLRHRPAAARRRPVPGIRAWHAPRLHLHADDPLEVTLDGEILGTLPGIFEVAGEALRVITPADFMDIDD